MYILTAPNIYTHFCNTEELAQKVKKYIESRHDCKINISTQDGLVYYDYPGAKCINPKLFNVVVGAIETCISDVDMLEILILNKQIDLSRGFVRLPSFHANLCLTEKEFEDTKNYILNNQDQIKKYIQTAREIIRDNFK